MKRGRPPRGRPTGRGHRVARAAGKKQSRRNSAGRSASTARSGKPRAGAKRRAATGPRSGAAGKKSAKRASAKRTGAPLRSAGSRAGAPTRATRAATRRAAPARGRVAAVRTAGRVADVRAERAAVKAAIQGLSAGNAGRPIATGKWSPLEIVLHLGERDRVRLEEFHRTLHGQPRTWAGVSDAEQAVQNEQHLAPLRALTWDSAVRRLDSLREQLLLRLHEVPALPNDIWQRGHAFADMMWGLPEHDRHHADQIKRARTGEPVLTED